MDSNDRQAGPDWVRTVELVVEHLMQKDKAPVVFGILNTLVHDTEAREDQRQAAGVALEIVRTALVNRDPRWEHWEGGIIPEPTST